MSDPRTIFTTVDALDCFIDAFLQPAVIPFPKRDCNEHWILSNLWTTFDFPRWYMTGTYFTPYCILIPLCAREKKEAQYEYVSFDLRSIYRKPSCPTIDLIKHFRYFLWYGAKKPRPIFPDLPQPLHATKGLAESEHICDIWEHRWLPWRA